MLKLYLTYKNMTTKKKGEPIQKRIGKRIEARRSTYQQIRRQPTGFKVNTTKEGEPIERKIERIVTNKEPIKDGAPIIFTERKEGVRASTNIRTDRFEIAIEAADKIAKSYTARRDEKAKPKDEQKGDGKPESTEGKPGTGTDKAK